MLTISGTEQLTQDAGKSMDARGRLKSKSGAGIGARDDPKLSVALCANSSFDFLDHILERNDILAVEVPTLFLEYLILNLNTGRPYPLE
jgi:hypothetical protein